MNPAVAGCLLVLWAAWLPVACAPSATVPASAEPATGFAAGAGNGGADQRISIFVTSNGWHTEIVLPKAALPAGAIPEAADFPRATYLGFGWGHAEYYPAPDPGIGLTLKAALIPSPAVMHVIGLGADPREAFRHR